MLLPVATIFRRVSRICRRVFGASPPAGFPPRSALTIPRRYFPRSRREPGSRAPGTLDRRIAHQGNYIHSYPYTFHCAVDALYFLLMRRVRRGPGMTTTAMPACLSLISIYFFISFNPQCRCLDARMYRGFSFSSSFFSGRGKRHVPAGINTRLLSIHVRTVVRLRCPLPESQNPRG